MPSRVTNSSGIPDVILNERKMESNFEEFHKSYGKLALYFEARNTLVTENSENEPASPPP